jgi:hypothetical protein
MMRSSDYARTPPEPPWGLPVLVVRLVAIIMGRNLCGGRWGVNGPKRRKIRRNEVEQGIVVAP